MHHRPHDQGGLPPGVGLPPGRGSASGGFCIQLVCMGGGELGRLPPQDTWDTTGYGQQRGGLMHFLVKNTINTNDSKLFQLILHDHLEVPSKWEKEFHMPNRLSSDITQDFNPCYFNSMPLISQFTLFKPFCNLFHILFNIWVGINGIVLK